ncbi:MAG: glycosyltransferase [Bacteroidia bacterium]|nr:glycosyltransferase [Bacteroidia bacterium]
MEDKTLVSVHMVTYNHEPFIREAIEGVLKQKTSFQYELLIGEDCSTDRTLEICKEYALKYPHIIKLHAREKNMGMVPNFYDLLLKCKGKYVAFCEGDDVWIDEYKLQKQVEFLEKNPDFSGACSKVKLIDENSNEHVNSKNFLKHLKTINESIDISLDYYLSRPYSEKELIFTPTLIVRKEVIPFDKLPNYSMFSDSVIRHHSLVKGSIKYFKDEMAAYRQHSGGITHTQHMTKHFLVIHELELLYKDLYESSTSEHLKEKIRKKIQSFQVIKILWEKKNLFIKIFKYCLMSLTLVIKKYSSFKFFFVNLKIWFYVNYPKVHKTLKRLFKR